MNAARMFTGYFILMSSPPASSLAYRFNDSGQITNIHSGPEKFAHSLIHHHFATVCSRITQFSPKCSKKIAVYQSMQNLYQLVKYFLINNRNWIHVVSDVTLHVNTTPLTVEDRLLIKTSQTEKG